MSSGALRVVTGADVDKVLDNLDFQKAVDSQAQVFAAYSSPQEKDGRSVSRGTKTDYGSVWYFPSSASPEACDLFARALDALHAGPRRPEDVHQDRLCADSWQ